MPGDNSLTYKAAGVDIDAGNRLVERIRADVERTRRPEVLAGLGGFGGLFELPLERYRRPVLVSGTDGVGTKLKLALDCQRLDGIGIDLVAMCVNDVVVAGAEPLFFLDYYATGHLNVEAAALVIRGVARGCEDAGAALIGGETAEMPGLYRDGEFDLAGFCVGIVERDALIDGSRVSDGDVVIGLASSGPHSNGYSLIRRILADTQTPEPWVTDALLAPTRIYVRALRALMEALPVHAMAHITGGGLLENIPRVLPAGLEAVLRRERWQPNPVFHWLQQQAGVSDQEMLRTFNCGIGMVVMVGPDEAEPALAELAAAGETAWPIGHVRAGGRGVVVE